MGQISVFPHVVGSVKFLQSGYAYEMVFAGHGRCENVE